MKMILNTLMLTTMAVAGFAADRKLNFHVEFPFTVDKVVMPAGQYSVMNSASSPSVIQLRNIQEHKSVFVNLPTKTQTRATEQRAQIVFRCGESGCSIAKIANLVEGHAFLAWASKETGARMIAVNLTPTAPKAD